MHYAFTARDQSCAIRARPDPPQRVLGKDISRRRQIRRDDTACDFLCKFATVLPPLTTVRGSKVSLTAACGGKWKRLVELLRSTEEIIYFPYCITYFLFLEKLYIR